MQDLSIQILIANQLVWVESKTTKIYILGYLYCAYSHVIFKLIHVYFPDITRARSSLINGLDCGLDRWTELLDWIAGMDCWTGLLDWIAGLDCWTGLLDWIAGLDCWTGLLDWIAGLDSEERCQTSMQDCMCSEDLCLTRSYERS